VPVSLKVSFSSIDIWQYERAWKGVTLDCIDSSIQRLAREVGQLWHPANISTTPFYHSSLAHPMRQETYSPYYTKWKPPSTLTTSSSVNQILKSSNNSCETFTPILIASTYRNTVHHKVRHSMSSIPDKCHSRQCLTSHQSLI